MSKYLKFMILYTAKVCRVVFFLEITKLVKIGWCILKWCHFQRVSYDKNQGFLKNRGFFEKLMVSNGFWLQSFVKSWKNNILSRFFFQIALEILALNVYICAFRVKFPAAKRHTHNWKTCNIGPLVQCSLHMYKTPI